MKKGGKERKLVFNWNGLAPTEVDRLARFGDLVYLMSFILIVCSGDLINMRGKVSEMTWLE